MNQSNQGPSRRRRKDARPAELLEAALSCFAEKGFAGTRMDDIAARAGVSKGTFYLYYPSKEAVFEALVRENLLPRLDAMAAIAGREATKVTDRLRVLLSALGAIINDPARVAIPKLVLTEAGNFPDMARFYRREVIGRGLSMLSGLLQAGVAAGEFRHIADPMVTARLFMAPVLLAALWKTSFAAIEENPLSTSVLLDQHADLFLRGLAADRVAEECAS